TYDKAVQDHYDKVAAECGDSPTSTMADAITRRIETDAVVGFIRLAMSSKDSAIADVGCGNGYTLAELAQRFPHARLTGFEQNAAMRVIAERRFDGSGVRIFPGDIRNAKFADGQKFGCIVCQRVLINLLDPRDQKMALDNLVAATKPGGHLIFIEAFTSGLGRLNTAREEFGLPPLPAAEHNLYLPDDFFMDASLTPFSPPGWHVSPNELSTHYFVSRVLHPALLGTRPFVRNSEFVRFFSEALPPAIGDYTQLRILAFTRRA
ncbi:MAG: class I SAM-dependent methyltransferase, partial [Stellaceae bacterium]